jgi:glycosyltransferase involved in cell wall biosynthesis
MEDKPFFSVIIPAYNRAHFITATIEHFLGQTYAHFELIIVDDGSTDNTEDVVKTIKDTRVYYFKKENGERGAARNFGANRAKGDYFNFFDSDDVAYSHHLETAKQVIQQLKNPPVFNLGSEIKNEKNEIVHKYNVVNGLANERILRGNDMNPNAVFIKKDVFKEVKFNENRQLAGTEDWLFNLQLAARYDFNACDMVITNGIIQHDSRSMKTTTGDSTLQRAVLLEKYLREDVVFWAKYSRAFPFINYEMRSLSALYYALEGQKRKAIKYFFQALQAKPFYFFSKRVFAIIKNILIH